MHRAGVPLKALEGSSFFPLSVSAGSRHSLAHGCFILTSDSIVTWHPLLPVFLLSVCLIRTVVIGFRAHVDNPGWSLLHDIAKALVPNKFLSLWVLDVHISLRATVQPARCTCQTAASISFAKTGSHGHSCLQGRVRDACL